MKPTECIILALDFPGKKEAFDFLPHLPELSWVKVGMELFYREGPGIVYDLKNAGYKVFLDLKLHDIPNTVGRATRVLAGLGADMLNYHAAGGSAMLAAAAEAALRSPRPPLLIGVTQLTSTTQKVLEEEIGVYQPLEQVVLHYARLAKAAGFQGVVCSAQETPLLKRELGRDFLTVTPGIRLAGEETQDQRRVTTPAEALAFGSDYLVIGRTLTRAKDPAQVWESIKSELNKTGGNQP